MSTRAIIAFTRPDGTWQGVWNHQDSHTQHLGRALIRQVSRAKGNLEQAIKAAILDAPAGWSSFASTEKRDAEAPEPYAGGFDGVIATVTADPGSMVFDTHYLYLFHPPKRRLLVFEMSAKPMRPFGMVTFDEAGRAKPSKLPPVPE